MKFYTNVFLNSGKLYCRGYDNGNRTQEVIRYAPVLYTQSKDPNTEFRSIHKAPLKQHRFQSIRDAKDFVEKYKDVHNMKIFGNDSFVYSYIAENFVDDMTVIDSDVTTVWVDIETTVGEGGEGSNFPNVFNPKERINLITIINSKTKETKTFGTIVLDNPPVCYEFCESENILFRQFIRYFSSLDCDISSGWNSNPFDLSYIIERGRVVVGDVINELSPWGKVSTRESFDENGNASLKPIISGIACLDYLALYKKYSFTPQENYKLETVAVAELGVGKLELPFDSFTENYTGISDVTECELSDHLLKRLACVRTKIHQYLKSIFWVPHEIPPINITEFGEQDFVQYNENLTKILEEQPDVEIFSLYTDLDYFIQNSTKKMFIEYNIIDAMRVLQIDEKRQFINLSLSLAHLTRVNYEDVFSPVKMWESYIQFTLSKDNIFVEIKSGKSSDDSDGIDGAFVKEPIPGLYKWIVTRDLKALYPSILIGLNMSPETIVDDVVYSSVSKDSFEATGTANSASDDVIVKNVALALNGISFDRMEVGVMPRLAMGVLDGRDIEKTKMKEAAKKLESIKKELEKRGIE
jgi:DNA polymerase elongation subunit (family B)